MSRIDLKIFRNPDCDRRSGRPRRPPADGGVDTPDGWRGRLSMVRFWAETANMGIFDLSQLRTLESGLNGGGGFPFIDANSADTAEILEDFFGKNP